MLSPKHLQRKQTHSGQYRLSKWQLQPQISHLKCPLPVCSLRYQQPPSLQDPPWPLVSVSESSIWKKLCSSEDLVNGLFYICALYGFIRVQKNQNHCFTVGCWLEHKMSRTHIEGAITGKRESISAKKNTEYENLTKSKCSKTGKEANNSIAILFQEKRQTHHQLSYCV